MYFYSFAPNYIEDRDLSSKWLFEFVADQWKQWLPDQARRDLATKGYYTLLVRPNLRLIALNSNVCNVDNLYDLYNSNQGLDKAGSMYGSFHIFQMDNLRWTCISAATFVAD